MAYNPTHWKDRVVERPRTYTEAVNSDGSKTYTPAPGEVVEAGTPQSATNFNHIEEGLTHYAAAFDMLLTIHQAEMRQAQADIAALQEQVAALAGGES